MILVTGAAGLVGGNLVRALLAEGQPVRALVFHDRRAIAGLDVEVARGDICDAGSLGQAFAGVEVVYNLAGSISLEMNSWEAMHAINVTGTRHVVEACLRAGVRRLVHFSSIHALRQDPYDRPVDEMRPLVDDLRAPPYDRSKALGEREVQAGIARGLDAVTLNPTGILGPYDYKPSFLGSALWMLARGRIPALVAGGFDWVDVRDVAQGAIRAARLGKSGESYLLGGHWHSVREMAGMVALVSGRPAPVLSIPMALAIAGAPLMGLLARFNNSRPIYTRVSLLALRSNRRISHAKAERELGYHPRPLAETVADTVAWFQQAGEQGRAGEKP